MYLYILFYFMHLLYLLNISIYELLKQNNKKFLTKKTYFIIYNNNKLNFISLIESAR